MNVNQRNFYAFLWHASFLAFASSFIELNTVIPSLIIRAGGSEFTLGIVTAIMVGIPLLAQLLFASFLVTKKRKKPYLLIGINLRIISLLIVGIILITSNTLISSKMSLFLIILTISVFSFSGVFAGVSYTDLLGKSISKDYQKKFMSTRQIVKSFLALFGALLAKYILKILEYPKNYSLMFFIASISLFIASFGFWAISEEETKFSKKYPSFYQIIKNIPSILSKDRNLLNFVIYSNLTGFGITIIPFYVLLAKNSFPSFSNQIGNFLLLQMIGIVLSSFFLKKILHRKGYKGVLLYCTIIGSMVPFLALVFSHFSPFSYAIIFFISGFTLSARQMAFEGILIEISNNENRALYVGISGALNIVTAILPLIIGSVIKNIGFTAVFCIVSISIASSLIFLNKIKLDS